MRHLPAAHGRVGDSDRRAKGTWLTVRSWNCSSRLCGSDVHRQRVKARAAATSDLNSDAEPAGPTPMLLCNARAWPCELVDQPSAGTCAWLRPLRPTGVAVISEPE